MYSDKAHINYLTSILLTQGITDIVVCPGARNAPLCHNFHQLALHSTPSPTNAQRHSWLLAFILKQSAQPSFVSHLGVRFLTRSLLLLRPFTAIYP